MISPPDRVTIWQSQLTANDFPPVCAMSGQPAETWHKFRFATAPPWAFLLGAIVVAALSRRASGYLPLTRASLKKLRLVTWTFVGLLPLAVVFWVAAALVAPSDSDPTRSAITGILVLMGFISLIVGLIGVILRARFFGPTGKVMEQQPGYYEPVIELQRVHPNFVAAVRQRQQERAAQYGSPAQLQPQPGPYPYQPG